MRLSFAFALSLLLLLLLSSFFFFWCPCPVSAKGIGRPSRGRLRVLKYFLSKNSIAIEWECVCVCVFGYAFGILMLFFGSGLIIVLRIWIQSKQGLGNGSFNVMISHAGLEGTIGRMFHYFSVKWHLYDFYLKCILNNGVSMLQNFKTMFRKLSTSLCHKNNSYMPFEKNVYTSRISNVPWNRSDVAALADLLTKNQTSHRPRRRRILKESGFDTSQWVFSKHDDSTRQAQASGKRERVASIREAEYLRDVHTGSWRNSKTATTKKGRKQTALLYASAFPPGRNATSSSVFIVSFVRHKMQKRTKRFPAQTKEA